MQEAGFLQGLARPLSPYLAPLSEEEGADTLACVTMAGKIKT